VTSGRTLAALLALLAAALVPAAAGAAEPPDGLLEGAPHVLRLRPRLADVPAGPRRVPRRDAAASAAAVGSCDPAQVDALDAVPTTTRVDDAASTCVVLARADANRKRALLAASRLSGDAIDDVRRRRTDRDRYEVVLRPTARGTALLAATPPELAALPQQLDVDGVVVGDATVEISPSGDTSVVVTPAAGGAFSSDVAAALVARIRQAREEQLVALADEAMLTRAARELVADADARIDDKDDFTRECTNGELGATLTLGCYTGEAMFVLRVDQLNLAGVMNVSLAHEMLHAAFDRLSKGDRREITDRLERFMATTGDDLIEELLVEYERAEPGQRATELHSLIGTQVGDLPRALERYYRRYFEDRTKIVEAFEGYQSVFDDLQARYDELKPQADSLAAQIADTDAAFGGASADADRLYEQIQSLRAQGRFDESNALVDAQNAAADRANALVEQYNSLVARYNSVVDELNTLAAALNESYNAISPVPIELQTEQ